MRSRQLQQVYLNAIGIQSWQLKDAPVDNEPEDIDEDILQPAEQIGKTEVVSAPIEQVEQINEPVVEQVEQINEIVEIVEQIVEQEAGQAVEYHNPPLNTTDSTIQVEPIIQPEPEPEPIDSVSKVSLQLDTDSELAKKIQQCHSCPSRSQRLNTLAGQGSEYFSGQSSEQCSILFISDAPDADEDRAGHYLIESTMSLFSAMLESTGITQEYFYTGIVKCHSLQDFVVSKVDIQHCSTFLEQQIIQLKPRLIVILGINPARALLQTTQAFKQLRGQIHKLTIAENEFPVLLSYHPSYLIRNPLYKREAMADLIQIKQYLHGSC